MSEPPSRRMISSRLLKLEAGGVSVAAMALLAVGFFADSPAPISTVTAPASPAPNSRSAVEMPSGSPALHAAIAGEHSELVRILVEGGGDVDAKNNFGDPALHAAIAGDEREMARVLIEAGADVDTKDRFGDPALHQAIEKGDSELVRILVDAGANVNITNAFGDPALSRAVHEGNTEIVQILANAGGS